MGETLQNRISALGNGTKKINPKLWLLGVSAVLGFAKAPAQEAHTQLSKDTIVNTRVADVRSNSQARDSLAPDFMALDSLKPAARGLSPTDSVLARRRQWLDSTPRGQMLPILRNYLKIDPKIENIRNFLDAFKVLSPSIIIDSIGVKNPYDLATRQGYYDPKTQVTRICYYYMELTESEHNLRDDPRNRKITWRELAKEVKMANANIPNIFFHEFFGHFVDRNCYIPFGFTSGQIEQINIHEEIIGPLQELILAREKVRAGCGVDAAFAAKEFREDSKIFHDNYSYSTAKYADWLRKHPDIGEIPTVEEIDVMMTASLRAMNSGADQYRRVMPSLIEDDFHRSKYTLKYLAYPEKYEHIAVGFDDALHRFYTTPYGIDFIGAMGDRMRATIIDYTNKFRADRQFRKRMDKVHKIFEPADWNTMTGDMMDKIRQSHESPLDADGATAQTTNPLDCRGADAPCNDKGEFEVSSLEIQTQQTKPIVIASTAKQSR